MEPYARLIEALEAAAAHFRPPGASLHRFLASAERVALARSLEELAQIDSRRLRIPEQTAFWLNLYNACVLRDAAEFDRKSFFTRPRIRAAGHEWSLDDVEHGLLRGNAPKYGALHGPLRNDDPRRALTPLLYDERMHFAMFLPCRSSPPLRVFHGGRLDEQLEEATASFLRASVRVEDDGGLLVVPKLFHWYASDFGDVLDFVAARLADEQVEAIDRRQGRVRIEYAEFDWSV